MPGPIRSAIIAASYEDLLEASSRLADAVLSMERSGVMNDMDARKVVEILSIANGIAAAKDKSIRSKAFRSKNRCDFLVGEAFVFLSASVPREIAKAVGISDACNSIVFGAFDDDRMSTATLPENLAGKLCGNIEEALHRPYRAVNYTLMEHSVKAMNEVQNGDVFIHGDKVCIRAYLGKKSYFASMDGEIFREWDDAPSLLAGFREVTILKPEFSA